jgi:hypothetical protein
MGECDATTQAAAARRPARLDGTSVIVNRVLDGEAERRARFVRRARIVVLALVIGYFFLPYAVKAWIPVWLPFLAAVVLEVHFFVGGWRSQPNRMPARDRGPQPHDLAELGWEPEFEDEEFSAYYAPAAEEPRYARHVAEAVVALAIFGGILFYAVRPHGWKAVSAENQARAEAVFSAAATRIAGHPAAVVCDTSGRHVGVVQDADGAANVGGRVAYLVPRLCDELYQLRFKHRVRSFSQTARAIAVLAHEAWHLNGIGNEGLANCFGFQSGVQVGVELGLSESRARSMMREQLATNASDSGSNTAYLVPPGCRDGGEYDLNPASPRFP